MNWISKGSDLCLFMEVTDEQLDVIQQCPKYYLDTEFVRRCAEESGDNALINLLILKKGTKNFRWGLNVLRESYKTVCFWNRDHKKFYKWRGKNVVHIQGQL